MLQKPEINVLGPKNIVGDKILHFGICYKVLELAEDIYQYFS